MIFTGIVENHITPNIMYSMFLRMITQIKPSLLNLYMEQELDSIFKIHKKPSTHFDEVPIIIINNSKKPLINLLNFPFLCGCFPDSMIILKISHLNCLCHIKFIIITPFYYNLLFPNVMSLQFRFNWWIIENLFDAEQCSFHKGLHR